MGNASGYRRCGPFLPALAFVWSALLYAPYAAAVEDQPLATKPSETPAAMAKYRQELEAYLQAREDYQAAAKTYWSSITEKRRLRSGKRARGAPLSLDDYVLDQPPAYSGPPKPRDPSKPAEPPQPPPYVPVVADFLAAAVTEFKFTPRMPRNDGEFKRAYVVAVLAARAQQLPNDEKNVLEKKLAIVRKMIAFAKSVPDDWNEHEILARTQKGLAIHALNLDLDFGPLLQTQKLLDSIVFARRKGFARPLNAAELEMMNLTGDGNGFDMVTMPLDWRDKVPTSNFFQQHGYADNPVVQRNNVVAKLLAATDAVMDGEVKKAGAKELAAAFP
jgi:hypothetical protein